jgi:hypothetical protein
VTEATNEFIQKGFVDKGLKGELYGRLLCCIAIDALYREALHVAAKEKMPPRTASYTLRRFLLSLYGKEHAAYIDVIESVLLDTRINFTHFAVTEEPLTPDVLPTLLRDLLRSRAALQLSFGQEYIDLIIPGYQGLEDEELDPQKCVYVGVQIKAKSKATLPRSVLKVDFHNIDPPFEARTMSTASRREGTISNKV